MWFSSNGKLMKLKTLHLSRCGQDSLFIFSFNSSKEALHWHGGSLRETLSLSQTLMVIIACACVWYLWLFREACVLRGKTPDFCSKDLVLGLLWPASLTPQKRTAILPFSLGCDETLLRSCVCKCIWRKGSTRMPLWSDLNERCPLPPPTEP